MESTSGDHDRAPRMTAGLEIREIGDEVFVHDQSAGKLHVLNPVAGAILQLCDGIHSPGAIASEISRKTGEDPSVVEADLTEILAEFGTLGLIA